MMEVGAPAFDRFAFTCVATQRDSTAILFTYAHTYSTENRIHFLVDFLLVLNRICCSRCSDFSIFRLNLDYIGYLLHLRSPRILLAIMARTFFCIPFAYYLACIAFDLYCICSWSYLQLVYFTLARHHLNHHKYNQ